MAELAEGAASKKTPVGNSIIIATNVTGFLMNLKGQKFRNFISLILCSILAVDLMGVLITEGSQLDSPFCSHMLKEKTPFKGYKNNLTIQVYLDQ